MSGAGAPRRLLPRLANLRARVLDRLGKPVRAVVGLAALGLVGLGAWWLLDGAARGIALVVGGIALALAVGPDVPAQLRARRRRSAGWLLMRDYARIARTRGRRALIATLSRTRSVEAREILAFLASDGELSMADFSSSLEWYRDPTLRKGARRYLRRIRAGWSLELARILSIQPASPTDVLNGATLYEVLAERDGSGSLPREHQRVHVEDALLLGRVEEARRTVTTWDSPSDIDLRVSGDTVNPWIWPDGSEQEWHDRVGAPYLRDGVEPVRVRDGAGSPFSRLTASAAPLAPTGHTVTVIVSAFRPDDLPSAIDSVLASTWVDLEVIVVDDASGPDFDDVFAAVAQRDARITVVRLTANGGTYRARNHALGIASGEFVTFHDSDDWMHPRRIERQVAALLEDPSLVATAVRSVRVSDRLRFSTRRSPYAKICEPSLLYRRDEVTRRIGVFDEVRKSGDIEFRRRLQTVFGIRVTVIGEAPLVLQLSADGSLSDDDIGRDWIRPARLAYARAAELWHARIAAGEAEPRLPRADGSRPFWAPVQMTATRVDPARYDVVFLSSWSTMGSRGGSQRSNEEEIRALVAAGKRVAVAHVEALWFLNQGRWKLSSRLVELLDAGLVDLVDLDQPTEADLLIVRYPPVLQFLDPRRSAIEAHRVIIVANQPPYDRDGSARRYRVDDCSARVHDVFGRRPHWVPQSQIVRELLSELVPPDELLDIDMPALVDPRDWRVTRAPLIDRKPVVGRYSRDTASKWPEDRAELLRAYRSDGFDAVLMGGPETIRRVVGSPRRWPRSWTVYATGEIPTRELLARIDFFVYFHHSHYREAFGRSIVEALASGAVVVLPATFEPVFGAAAVYTTPRGVDGLVRRLAADPAAYAAQVARGYEFVAAASGHAGYVAVIERLVGEGAETP